MLKGVFGVKATNSIYLLTLFFFYVVCFVWFLSYCTEVYMESTYRAFGVQLSSTLYSYTCVNSEDYVYDLVRSTAVLNNILYLLSIDSAHFGSGQGQAEGTGFLKTISHRP